MTLFPIVNINCPNRPVPIPRDNVGVDVAVGEEQGRVGIVEEVALDARVKDETSKKKKKHE